MRGGLYRAKHPGQFRSLSQNLDCQTQERFQASDFCRQGRTKGSGLHAGGVCERLPWATGNTTTTRVALYARVSTTNHGQDAGLQTRELRQFHNGFTVRCWKRCKETI
jgi:hypothetical protein